MDWAWAQSFKATHGRYPSFEDERIRLFSIAYPEEHNSSTFYESDGRLKGTREVDEVFINPPQTRSWDTMPDALVRLSRYYSEGEKDAFVRDVAFLYAALPARHLTMSEPYWSVGAIHSHQVYLQPGSLDPKFWRTDIHDPDPAANVHHWAWAFSVGYNIDFVWGMWINEGRECLQHTNVWPFVDLSDVEMGDTGIMMGHVFRSTTYDKIPELFRLYLGIGR